MRTARKLLAVALLFAFALSVAPAAQADNTKPVPPPSHAYGKSLDEWMTLHTRFVYEGGADRVGKVRFMPLPAGEQVEGSFTYFDPALIRGRLEVTLERGSPFALPFNGWVGETYLPDLGQPDDKPVDRANLTNSELLVTLDGRAIVDSAKDDLDKYYFAFTLEPPILYDEPTSYGSIGVIWVQGLGFVHPPLSVGEHRLTLHSELLLPPGSATPVSNFPDGIGVIYENEWIITVTR